MKTKKSALKAIKDLKKYFEGHQIDISNEYNALKKNLESIEEESSGPSGHGDFVLPKDVELSDRTYFVYSDGACRGNPGIGAYGYMVQNSQGEVISEGAEFDSQTTNNQMELLGAIEGVKDLVSKMDDTIIYLYSDSRYLVDGVNKWIDGWKKRGWRKADNKEPSNLALWQEVDYLNTNYQIHFNWVKGHAGHPQNERCDQLANECIDQNL